MGKLTGLKRDHKDEKGMKFGREIIGMNVWGNWIGEMWVTCDVCLNVLNFPI